MEQTSFLPTASRGLHSDHRARLSSSAAADALERESRDFYSFASNNVISPLQVTKDSARLEWEEARDDPNVPTADRNSKKRKFDEANALYGTACQQRDGSMVLFRNAKRLRLDMQHSSSTEADSKAEAMRLFSTLDGL
jgi:hypothetical protein